MISNVIVGGHLLGDVTSQESIASLQVTGDIGSSTNTVSITAGDQIREIIAGTIWANIESVARDPIEVFRTTDGDFNGSLTIGDAGSASGTGVEIARDVNAEVTIDGDVVKPIRIRRSLIGDIDIDGALVDQVFINSADDSGSWSGDIFVGSTTLSPKGAYTQTGLGGGAVGLAPFDLHKQDCDPPYSGSTWPTTTSATLDIDLVHYGPIEHDGAGAPFLVFRYPGAHCDIPNCEGGTNDMANWSLDSISGRTMTVSASLDEDYHYHVTPVRTGSNMLKCDGLDATGDVPVKDYTYVIYREAP